MAKAKATDSDKIEIKTAPKIADVTDDASVGAAAGSRPVIVSNRPIMRDPMMVASTNNKTASDEKTAGSPATEDPVGAPLLNEKLEPPSVTKKRLVPPSEKKAAEETPKKALATDITGASDTDKITTKIDVVGVTTHDSIPESTKAAEVTKDETTKTKDSDTGTTPDTETSSESEAGSGTAGKDGEEGSDDANRRLDEANQIADTREADEAAKIAKLVEAKTYVLPINAVQRRRSQQMAVLGLLVIIVLAFAWLDLATDVGLVKVPYLPVTHFFSN